jgi:hypothetical protein
MNAAIMMTRKVPRVSAPDDERSNLGRGARAAGIVAWSAFLAAALATMLCFAFVDPVNLAKGELPPWWGTRLHVYAIGFFFFWLIGLCAAWLTWILTSDTRRVR